jgi:biotin transport system substrate-specific component
MPARALPPASALVTNTRSVLAVLIAAALVWVAATLTFPLPGTSVPQTAQTLAVLVAGAWLGPWRGGLAMVVYLIAGAAGLPVFAGGAAGTGALAGPTGGFLVGFVPGAALAGLASSVLERPHAMAVRLVALVLLMLAAHLIILLCGWVRLTASVGPLAALHTGVLPFLGGAMAKALAAAALAWLVRRWPA